MNDEIQIENPMHVNKKIHRDASNNGITILMPVTINFLQKSDEQSDECIICLHPGNLITNVRCSCVYFYHKECNDKTEYPNRCVLCKKDYALVNNNNDDFNSCICPCIVVFAFIIALILIFFFTGTMK
jgi:hypothetical protein